MDDDGFSHNNAAFLDDDDSNTEGPIGQINPNFDLENERLDCERIDDMTTPFNFIYRPSFVTVLMRFFGNMFVDIFKAIFS